MKAFVVCLYDWDNTCDIEVLAQILAVYETLEKAVQFSRSYKNYHDGNHAVIDILELDGSTRRHRYTKNGEKLE